MVRVSFSIVISAFTALLAIGCNGDAGWMSPPAPASADSYTEGVKSSETPLGDATTWIGKQDDENKGAGANSSELRLNPNGGDLSGSGIRQNGICVPSQVNSDSILPILRAVAEATTLLPQSEAWENLDGTFYIVWRASDNSVIATYPAVTFLNDEQGNVRLKYIGSPTSDAEISIRFFFNCSIS